MEKHSQPTIEILVCTMDDGIRSVAENMLPKLSGVLITVSHQITDERYRSEFIWPEEVQYVALESIGLSKNRNNALIHARGDICVIADDDIDYTGDFLKVISRAYENNRGAAAITFQADGLVRWEKSFAHNWRTIMQVASWMITFRRDWVLDNNISFDERFGLGARYPQGEENIFLSDILRGGGEVFSDRSVFVRHSDVSSGFLFTPDRVTAKIMAARRIYGNVGAFCVLAVFSVTKHRYYSKQDIGFLQFLKFGLQSFRENLAAN